MKTFLAWLQAFALAIGGPGLFIIAFLDSSFLSLPQLNDLLVVTMVVPHPARFAYYALMATLGSVAGCLALYGVGRRGGDALLRTRFGSGRMQRVTRIFQRAGPGRPARRGPSAAAGAVQGLRAARRDHPDAGVAVHGRHRDRQGRPVPDHRAAGRLVRPPGARLDRSSTGARSGWRSRSSSWSREPDGSGGAGGPRRARRFDRRTLSRYNCKVCLQPSTRKLRLPLRRSQP